MPGTISATATFVFIILTAYSIPSLISFVQSKSLPLAAHNLIRALATPRTLSQISFPF